MSVAASLPGERAEPWLKESSLPRIISVQLITLVNWLETLITLANLSPLPRVWHNRGSNSHDAQALSPGRGLCRARTTAGRSLGKHLRSHVRHSGFASFFIIKVGLQIFGKDTDEVIQTDRLVSNISGSPLTPFHPHTHSAHPSRGPGGPSHLFS